MKNDDQIIAALTRDLRNCGLVLEKYVDLFWSLKDAMNLNSVIDFNPNYSLPDRIETIQTTKKDYEIYCKMRDIINEFDVSII
jgi:hypothetical protein